MERKETEGKEGKKTDGWREKEAEAAEVVNRSCGTHLSPLLTLCDLYLTNTHTQIVLGEPVEHTRARTRKQTQKYVARN